ncbi:MAG TPA: hypothetical protein DCP63_01290 [Bacteroidetes bacterium]|nr:hypothetical protein [Bacteroidota bacterium]
MKCEEHELRISKLADNELADHVTPELFTHLAGCSDCRTFFRFTLRLRFDLHNAPPLDHLDEDAYTVVAHGGGEKRRVPGGSAERNASSRPALPSATSRRDFAKLVADSVLLLLVVLLVGTLFSPTIELRQPKEIEMTELPLSYPVSPEVAGEQMR